MPVSSLARLFHWLRLPRSTQTVQLASKELQRVVQVDLYRHGRPTEQQPYHLICVNDGQDLARMQLPAVLAELPPEFPVLVAGIHADSHRMEEYGTVGQVDYQGRGARAAAYEAFVLGEFLPYLERRYRLSPEATDRAFVGFSLGGLSAFDLVWRSPQRFARVGVFSGSLWWRATPFRETAPDADRIVHDTVERDPHRPGLRFWFQAGTRDETDDRNGNGIIDAIDDTLQLITLLKLKGYTPDDIHYEEVEGGTHDVETWAAVFPQFLHWFRQQADPSSLPKTAYGDEKLRL
jgi:enterochelin esterase family protein